MATATPWTRWAGRLGLAAAFVGMSAGPSLAGNLAATGPVSCAPFGNTMIADADAPRATSRLTRGQPLVIVAIGSSSTRGVGASGPQRCYPATVQRLLRSRFPGVPVVVYNVGIGGQLASQMLARFDKDIWPLKPQLVLWQTGTIEALRHTALDVLRRDLRDGIGRIRRHGVEVVLIDQQYSSTLERRHPDYSRYVDAMREVARAVAVPLVDRYAAMRRWTDRTAGSTPMKRRGLLAPDRLHLNDDGYRCLARAVADFITCGTNAACLNGPRVAARNPL